MNPTLWLLWIALGLPQPGPLPAGWWDVGWSGFPSEQLVRGIGDLPATYHSREDWRWATWVETTAAGDPLPVPRLVLDAERYGRPRSLDEVPVDVAEHLLAAVLEGLLAGDPEWDAEVERRSRRLVGEWPPELGVAAVRTAFADLGGHLLSLALEIRRSADRLRDRGEDPCDWAGGEPRLIFALWPAAWRDAGFRPRLSSPWGVAREGPPLRPEDRDWLVRSVLGRRWEGRPIADLDLACGAADEAPDGR